MERKYSASVVGVGMGGRLSMKALQASSRFRLVAVADTRPAALEQAARDFPGVKCYPSHRAMFKDCPTDVTCIATYPPTHLPITRNAVRMLPLKGILVEKPLGDTAKAGREIIRLVRQYGLPMAVPHNLLTLPHTQEILRRVHAGEIGRLELMEVQCDKWDAMNAGIHWMNFFVTLTRNEPIAFVLAGLDATTRTYRDGMQVETEAISYVVTQSGVRAVMQTGDYVRTVREGQSLFFRLVGTGGLIEFPGWERSYTLLNREFPEGRRFDQFPPGVVGHQRHLEWLAGQMDTGQPDYTIPESSLLALEICEAIYISARTRQKVIFPLETFKPRRVPQWDPGRPYSGRGGGRDGRNLA